MSFRTLFVQINEGALQEGFGAPGSPTLVAICCSDRWLLTSLATDQSDYRNLRLTIDPDRRPGRTATPIDIERRRVISVQPFGIGIEECSWTQCKTRQPEDHLSAMGMAGECEWYTAGDRIMVTPGAM